MTTSDGQPRHRPRPLSPHLMQYRFQSNMALSILHRLTGIGLAVGLCLIVTWLYSLASGPALYAEISHFLASWFGLLLCVGLGLALCYHAATGLRHLVWDTGRGLELESLIRSNIAVITVATLLAVGLFFL